MSITSNIYKIHTRCLRSPREQAPWGEESTVFIQSLRAFRRAESRGRSLGGVGGPLGVPARHWGVPGGRWGGPLALSGSRGGPWEVVGGPWGVSGRPWGVPGGAWGGPWEAPEAPRGGPGRLRKYVKFSEGAWGGSRGGPGVILVIWGGPRDRPGRWKC